MRKKTKTICVTPWVLKELYRMKSLIEENSDRKWYVSEYLAYLVEQDKKYNLLLRSLEK